MKRRGIVTHSPTVLPSRIVRYLCCFANELSRHTLPRITNSALTSALSFIEYADVSSIVTGFCSKSPTSCPVYRANHGLICTIQPLNNDSNNDKTTTMNNKPYVVSLQDVFYTCSPERGKLIYDSKSSNQSYIASLSYFFGATLTPEDRHACSLDAQHPSVCKVCDLLPITRDLLSMFFIQL